MKVLYMVGHHVRKGQAVCLEGSDSNEPVRFFGEKRASAVRAIVERFNRMQVGKSDLVANAKVGM
jgi:hypothetical protein